eukprot:gene32310-39896_t
MLRLESTFEIHYQYICATPCGVTPAGSTSGAGLSANTWYLITLVVTRTVSSNIYINGALIYTGTSPQACDLSTNAVSYIGSYNAAGQEQFKGSIDDVRIYNRAISAAEVTALYGVESPSAVPTFTPSVIPTVTPIPSFSPTTIAPTSSLSLNLVAYFPFSGNALDARYFLRMQPDNSLLYQYVCVTPCGVLGQGSSSGAGLTINTWAMVTMVVTRAVSTKLYINGALLQTDSSPATCDLSSNAVSFIGAYNSGGTEQFRGSIDEVRIYNRAITAVEVTTLYGFESPTASPTFTPTTFKVKNQLAFAALNSSGHVMTWGSAADGGDSSAVIELLVN